MNTYRITWAFVVNPLHNLKIQFRLAKRKESTSRYLLPYLGSNIVCTFTPICYTFLELL